MVGKALTVVIREARIQGISTRPVDDLVKAMGMSGIRKSRGCAGYRPACRGVLRSADRPSASSVREVTGRICGSTPPA
jgi:hypothetical protein